jgi:ATPase subunit of ABC transporter with duplicated ATPase domains
VITRADPSTGRLLKKKMHAVKSQGRRLEKQKENMIDLPHFEQKINLMFDYEVQIPRGKMLLTLRIPELSVELTEGRKLLSRDIRLEIRSNEKVCIIGKNGAGKTTLLKRIREELSKRTDTSFAYMPQNYEELLDPEKTPEEFIARTGSKEERIIINNRLASLRFTPDDMNRRIGELSGGQKAKLLLLSLTLSGADILLLDEPTRNFSPLSGPVIRGILRDFSGAIISVSHDRKYIDEVPDRTYELTQEGLSLLIH